MAFKFSTGFRNGALVTGSVSTLLTGGFIDIYSGAVPADADASVGSAVLLTTISDNAGVGGLSFEPTASGGVLSKLGSQTWKGLINADGTASFFRYRLTGDTGALSTTAVRVQGTVGLAGYDMNLNPVVLAVAPAPQYQIIDYFSLNFLTA